MKDERMTRLQQTSNAHSCLKGASRDLLEMSDRLRGVYMDRLADDLCDISRAVSDASEAIRRFASEDLQADLEDGRRQTATILKGLLERATEIK